MSDLEHIAIERLETASEMSLRYYGLPLVITDSGGKDSSVCKELALRAGIPFEIMHNHTTADAPETVRFVRQEAERFEELGIKYTINMPMYKGQRTSMWSLIPQKLMPPTRIVRYCCAVLKETGGAGRFIATGVRWDESESRANSRGIYEKNGDKSHRIILSNDNDDRRLLFENCRLKSKRTVNPIIDWKTKDVFDFLEDAKKPVNPLYAEGWCRINAVMICKDCMRYDIEKFAPDVNHPNIVRILSIEEAEQEWKEMCVKALPREEPTLTACCAKMDGDGNG